MAKNYDAKTVVINEIKEKIDSSIVAIFADYRGLSVAQLYDLRGRLRETGTELKVSKNTMIKRAADELNIEGLEPYLEGPTVVAYNETDPATPAKVLLAFAKESKKLDVKSAVLEGKVIDLNEVKKLAELPSREQLLAKTLGAMQGPMYGFANVLHGNLRNLVYVLEAVRKKQAEEAGA